MSSGVPLIGEQAALANLYIQQGADYSIVFRFATSSGAAVDLTGSSFEAKIRKTKESTTSIDAFDITISGNAVTMALPRARSSAMPCGPSSKDDASIYFYDVEWTAADGTRKRPIEGRIFLSREVTR